MADAPPDRTRVVVDTNVFVAAGFRPDSASGRVVEAVKAGSLRMVWSDSTRNETEAVLRRIPPLDHRALLSDVFRDEDRWEQEPDTAPFSAVPDPADRKFAALAHAANALLITSDAPLLGAAPAGRFRAVSPATFLREHAGRLPVDTVDD